MTPHSYSSLEAFLHTEAPRYKCSNSTSTPNMKQTCDPKPYPRVVVQRCPKISMPGCPPPSNPTKCSWGRCTTTAERIEPPTMSVAEFLRPSEPIIRQLEAYDAPGSVITQKCRKRLADK